jgi:WD40 repeat protein
VLPANTPDMNSLAISWDGALLAVGGDRSYQVRLWDVRSGRELEPLELLNCETAALAFSPDGKTLISCDSDGDVRFWNLELRKHLMTVPNHNVSWAWLLLSADGSTIAWPAPKAWEKHGRLSIWRAPTLKEIDHQFAASPGLQ